MKIIERRIVYQDWYETEFSKTGWDNNGWRFDDGRLIGTDWTIVQILHSDKYGNPFEAVAEREVDI